MEWQPIETAPKDGFTRILVGHFDKNNKSYNGLMAVDYWHIKGADGFDGWGKFNPNFYPATHWMPLPDAPR